MEPQVVPLQDPINKKVGTVHRVLIILVSVAYIVMAVYMTGLAINAMGAPAAGRQGLGMILFLGWLFPPVLAANVGALYYLVRISSGSKQSVFRTDASFAAIRRIFIGSLIAVGVSLALSVVALILP